MIIPDCNTFAPQLETVIGVVEELQLVISNDVALEDGAHLSTPTWVMLI